MAAEEKSAGADGTDGSAAVPGGHGAGRRTGSTPVASSAGP